jgi:membrane protein
VLGRHGTGLAIRYAEHDVNQRPELVARGIWGSHLLPRFRTLIRLLRAAWQEYQRDYAKYFALAMIYYALVSLVPLLLLLLATLGFLLRVSTVAAAAEQRVLYAVQTSLGAEMAVTLHELLTRLQTGSIVAMSVSVVMLLLAGSTLFHNLRLSFRALWKHELPLAAGSVRHAVRETLMEQASAFLMLLSGGVLLILTLGFIAVVHWLSGVFSELPRFRDTTGWVLALPVSLSLATLTFALLFKYLPPVPLAWRHVWLASALCGVAWVVGADLLAWYASFGDGSPYGAIGALLVVALWVNFMSQVLFYGAEVCKVMAMR